MEKLKHILKPGHSDRTDDEPLSKSSEPTHHSAGSSGLPPQPSKDDSASTASIKSGVAGLPQPTSSQTAAPLLPSTGSQLPSDQHNTYGQDAPGVGSTAPAGTSALTGGLGDESAVSDQPLTGGPAEKHHEGYAHVQGTTTARKYSLGGSRRPDNIGGSPTSSLGADFNRETALGSNPPQSTGHSSGAAAIGAAGALGLGSREATSSHQPSHQPATYKPTGAPSANPAAVAAARQAVGQPIGSYGVSDPNAQVPYRAPGPHETDTANRLDPNVDPAALGAARTAPTASTRDNPGPVAGRGGAESAAQQAARAAPGAAARDEQSSHFGRNAGLAGAGAAVAGGAYAAGKDRDSAQSAAPLQADTGPAPHTIGPHKSDILNVLDPRVQPQPELMKGSSKGTTQTATDPAPHTTGPHKSDTLNIIDPRVQPQPEKMKSSRAGPTEIDPAPHTIGPHSSDVANVLDPRVQPEPEKQGARDREAGLGTAAVGAGALGAGALAAHEKDSAAPAQSTQPLASTTGQSSTQPSEGARPALTERNRTESYPDHGPLSDRRGEGSEKWHGWKNPYSAAAVDPRLDDMPGAFPETPSNQLDKPPLEEQQQQQRGGGLGSAAAVGAVGAGAGAGAYEASKLQSVGEEREPAGSAVPAETPRTPERNNDVGMAVTTDEAVASPTHHEFTRAPARGTTASDDAAEPDESSRHLGRDALVAGGVGAAGVGTYEAAKQLEQSKGPLSTKEIYGEDAVKPKPVQQTAPQAQPESPSSSKPIFGQFESKSQQQAPLASGGAKPIYGDFKQTSSEQLEADKGEQPSHHGRDAALAGGAGAAGLAAYEASKDQPKVPTSNKEIYGEDAVKPKPVAGAADPQRQQQPTNVPLSNREIYGDDAVKPKPVQKPGSGAADGDDRHYGRDAALAGGAGAAGVGAYEASKHAGQAQSVPAGEAQHTSPPAHLRAAHNIYPPELFQKHRQQPTSAATAGGLAGDSGTGEAQSAAQRSDEHHTGRNAALAGGAAGLAGAGAYAATRDAPQGGYETSPQNSKAFQHAPLAGQQQEVVNLTEYEQPRQAPQPPTQHPYGRDTALAGGAAAAGVGAHDYAPEPTGSQRDPVAALQSAVTQGYDDQRAAPHSGSQHFDPVRGGVLDDDGVSHPHQHAHPPYNPDQPPVEQPQVHRQGRDAAVAAAVGGGVAGAGMAGAGYAAAEAGQPSTATGSQEKFDPMNPTGVQHTGPFHHHQQHQQHQHTPSSASAKYSDENSTPDSPTSGKRKHKILTFLNKKDDKDASPRSSLEKDHGNKEVYTTRDPAAETQQQHPEQQGALHGLGGPEGHEFGALNTGEDSGLQSSTGGLSHHGSVRNVDGHNKLHKEPPKKWVEQHLGGQQGPEADAPPRID